MKIYSYASCGTCKKAIQWLDSNNIKFELIDILKDPPSRTSLVDASQKLGNRKYLFNTSGKSYRTIGSEVIKKMSEEEAFDILSKDPKLIKRPFLVTDDGEFLVGFKKDVWEERLLPT